MSGFTTTKPSNTPPLSTGPATGAGSCRCPSWPCCTGWRGSCCQTLSTGVVFLGWGGGTDRLTDLTDCRACDVRRQAAVLCCAPCVPAPSTTHHLSGFQTHTNTAQPCHQPPAFPPAPPGTTSTCLSPTPSSRPRASTCASQGGPSLSRCSGTWTRAMRTGEQMSCVGRLATPLSCCAVMWPGLI